MAIGGKTILQHKAMFNVHCLAIIYSSQRKYKEAELLYLTEANLLYLQALKLV